MRRSLLSLVSCLLFSATAASTVQAADLTQQRQYYDEAKRALAKGDSGPYRRYEQALRDYPLEPYLAYDELTARLKSASNAEIEKFLAEHGDLPQANWMKLRWLRWLAERGDWQPFVKYYDPKLNFTELDCLNGQYQLSHNLRAEGYATADKLWLVGKSQPAACDVLFDRWAAEGQLTEQKRWERIKLAAQARNYALANTLIKGLNTLGPQGRLLVDVAQKPELLNNPGRFTRSTKRCPTWSAWACAAWRARTRSGPWRCSTTTPIACISPATRRWRSPAKSALPWHGATTPAPWA